jgi:hypothetical protein
MFGLRKRAPEMFLPLLVILPLNLWIIASWTQWDYGGGYGVRPFIDSLPLMAVPLATVFASLRSWLSRVVLGGASVAAVAVCLAMMAHYWRLEIPPTGASAHDYLRVLLFR